MTEPLWAKDAVTVIDLLRSGEITPQEVLRATEERVNAVNPAVNALPTLCFERARDQISLRDDW